MREKFDKSKLASRRQFAANGRRTKFTRLATVENMFASLRTFPRLKYPESESGTCRTNIIVAARVTIQ
jgi:hypothetical protein